MGFTSNKDVLKLREQLLWGGLSSMTWAQPPSLYMVPGGALLRSLHGRQQAVANTYCWIPLTEHGLEDAHT